MVCDSDSTHVISREVFLVAARTAESEAARADALVVSKRRLRLLQLRVVVLLFMGYLSAVFCRADMDVALPLLITDPTSHLDRTGVGVLLACGTGAYCVGKLTTGVFADRAGGRRVFIIMMGLSAAATIGLALSGGPTSLTLLWMMNKFCQSAAWPALSHVVRGWFSSAAWGRVFGVLSVASCFGAVSANMTLGSLVNSGIHWRFVFMISGAILGGNVVVDLFLLQNKPPSQLKHLSSTGSASEDPN